MQSVRSPIISRNTLKYSWARVTFVFFCPQRAMTVVTPARVLLDRAFLCSTDDQNVAFRSFVISFGCNLKIFKLLAIAPMSF